MLRRIRETGMSSLAILGATSLMRTGFTMFSAHIDRVEDRQKLKKVTFAASNLNVSVYEFKRDNGIEDPEWNILHGQELTIEDGNQPWSKKVAASGKNGIENHQLLEQTLRCLEKVNNIDEYDKCASKLNAPAFK